MKSKIMTVMPPLHLKKKDWPISTNHMSQSAQNRPQTYQGYTLFPVIKSQNNLCASTGVLTNVNNA